MVPPGTAATLTLRLLAIAVSVDTPVTVISSNSAVARPEAPVTIFAGSRDATITILTDAPGEAVLTLSVGGEGRSLEVVVGTASDENNTPVTASPVGVEVEEGVAP